MRKILKIQGTQVHRVIVHFLLEESLKQYFLANRVSGIEEQLLKALIAENTRHLDKPLLDLVSNSTWWRRVKVAIEDCGLNHFAVARALAGYNDFETEEER